MGNIDDKFPPQLTKEELLGKGAKKLGNSDMIMVLEVESERKSYILHGPSRVHSDGEISIYLRYDPKIL